MISHVFLSLIHEKLTGADFAERNYPNIIHGFWTESADEGMKQLGEIEKADHAEHIEGFMDTALKDVEKHCQLNYTCSTISSNSSHDSSHDSSIDSLPLRMSRLPFPPLAT